MSTRALARRSREARAWLVDGLVPLWTSVGADRDGRAINALALNHRPGERPPPTTDPLSAARYAAAMARLLARQETLGTDRERLEIAVRKNLSLVPKTAETTAIDPEFGPAWLLAHALATTAGLPTDTLPSPEAQLSDTRARYQAQAPSGDVLTPAALTWLDACLALATLRPGAQHMGDASTLVASAYRALAMPQDDTSPAPIRSASAFAWVARLASHASQLGATPPPEALDHYRLATAALDPDGRAPAAFHPDGCVANPALTLSAQTAALTAHLTLLASGPDTLNRDDLIRRAMDSFDALMDVHLTPEGGWIADFDADGLPASQTIGTSHMDEIVLPFTLLIDMAAAW